MNSEKYEPYEYITLPISKQFYTLTAKEAELYFEWFIKNIPNRISILRVSCSRHLRVSETLLDFSPKSLIIVWRWFLGMAKVEPNPEYYNDNFFASLTPTKLTNSNQLLLIDVGIYFAQTIISNIKGMSWYYVSKPKKYIHVNRPLLKGYVDNNFTPPFQIDFEPIHMCYIQAINILNNNQSDNDLYNLYIKYEKYIH